MDTEAKQRAAKRLYKGKENGKGQALVGSPARLRISIAFLTASTLQVFFCSPFALRQFATTRTFRHHLLLLFFTGDRGDLAGKHTREERGRRCLVGDQVARRPKRLLLLLVRFF
jgi:hypothetical protein